MTEQCLVCECGTIILGTQCECPGCGTMPKKKRKNKSNQYLSENKELIDYLADLCVYSQEVNEGGSVESFKIVAKIVACFVVHETRSSANNDLVAWTFATTLSSGYIPRHMWVATITDLFKILKEI